MRSSGRIRTVGPIEPADVHAVATLLVAPVAYLALERGRREEGPPSGPRLAPEPAPW